MFLISLPTFYTDLGLGPRVAIYVGIMGWHIQAVPTHATTLVYALSGTRLLTCAGSYMKNSFSLDAPSLAMMLVIL